MRPAPPYCRCGPHSRAHKESAARKHIKPGLSLTMALLTVPPACQGRPSGNPPVPWSHHPRSFPHEREIQTLPPLRHLLHSQASLQTPEGAWSFSSCTSTGTLLILTLKALILYEPPLPTWPQWPQPLLSLPQALVEAPALVIWVSSLFTQSSCTLTCSACPVLSPRQHEGWDGVQVSSCRGLNKTDDQVTGRNY